MLRNILMTIVRYAQRQRFFTLINVIGLATSIACCLVIYLFVVRALSTDQFHADKEITYRVLRESTLNGAPYSIGVTSAPFLPALLTDYPLQITDGLRVFPFSGLVEYEDDAYVEKKLMLADENFFRFFSYPLTSGHREKVLSQPNAVAISTTLAAKYFGDIDPVGKTLRLDKEHDLTVTGVFENAGPSHLDFELVAPIALIENEPWFNEWWNNAAFTYIKVPIPGDVAFLNGHFPSFMDKYFGKDFERIGNRVGLRLEKLEDIYFNGNTRYETNVLHGDQKYIVIFTTVGVLLLLLAAINYVNLATAQSAARAREIGIRKTLGSGRRSIIIQYLSESFVVVLASLALAVAVVYAGLPWIAHHLGVDLQSGVNDPSILVFMLLLGVGLTLLAGGYPAFMMSGFRPMRMLKEGPGGGVRLLVVRKALIVFQFSASIFMIVITLLIDDQMQYMRHKDLGYQGDQVMVVRINNPGIRERLPDFQAALRRQHHVKSAAALSGVPGGFFDATTVAVLGMEEQPRMRTLYADEYLPETLGLDVVAGRGFSEEYISDRDQSVLLNETAVRELGWTTAEAIGQRVRMAQFDSTFKEVIGVLADFHYASLRQPIEPLVVGYGRGREVAIKISGDDLSSAVKQVEAVWSSFGSGFPMEWTFLNDSLDAQYRGEVRQGRLFTLFSGICLLIACLGILGLTTILVVQRKKEIGIRKALGASGPELSFFLMKDLMVLVLVAHVFAIPLGYWGFVHWLSGFAYQTEIQVVNFVLAALVVAGMAALIVGFRAAAAAAENPVDSLRSE